VVDHGEIVIAGLTAPRSGGLPVGVGVGCHGERRSGACGTREAARRGAEALLKLLPERASGSPIQRSHTAPPFDECAPNKGRLFVLGTVQPGPRPGPRQRPNIRGSRSRDGRPRWLARLVLFVFTSGTTEAQHAERATPAVAESVHGFTGVCVNGDRLHQLSSPRKVPRWAHARLFHVELPAQQL
jgi:hypothetical protein